MCKDENYIEHANLQTVASVAVGLLVALQYFKVKEPYYYAFWLGLPAGVAVDYGTQQYINQKSNKKTT